MPTKDAPPSAPVENVAARLAAEAAVPATPVWPSAASALVDLIGAGAANARAAIIGGLPVSVAPAASGLEGRAAGVGAGANAPGRVQVQVLGQEELAQLGRTGLAIRVSRADGLAATGRIALSVSYGGVAGAFGAGWGSRLKLDLVPECALITPDAPACRPTPVSFHNDLAARTLLTEVALPAGTSTGAATEEAMTIPDREAAKIVPGSGAVMLVASAGSSSAAGDYAATPLQPSATWSQSGSTGDFTWDYPVRVPPSLGGPAPSMALAYSSQSIDGLTSASNNQASWIGDGFSYQPGFIERRYNSCVDDGQAGKGDLCWGSDNATLTFSGHGGELIQVSTSPDVWRPVRDDGTRVERLRDTSKNNSDDDGEYWKVTTTDGVQYFFGLNRLPSATSGQPETNSVQYEPVYGDDSAEPCYSGSGFAASYCTQAYRWNLDYMVDLHQNTMSYWYSNDVNWYGQNASASTVGKYVRSSYLTRIDYGTDNRSGTDSTFTGTASARVLFNLADRCSSGCATHDAAHWPDVPWDQECIGSGGNPPTSCSNRYSPTFWSTKRLASVTTQVATGTQTWKDVSSVALGVQWLDPSSGDGGKVMWLNTITNTGLNGSAPDVAMPAVVINPTGTTMLNRVHNTDGNGSFNRFRIASIANEFGSVLGIAYSAPDCVWGVKMPASPETNTYRCFPVYWTPVGGSPILDYYHKYVVTSVTSSDNAGGGPTVATSYSYPTDGAFWHYDEAELTPVAKKTWAQWRGYEQVATVQGASGGTQTQVVSKYFRGMNGDKLPSGVRSKSYVVNATTYADENWLAGRAWERIAYNGVGGAVVTDTLTEPWQQGPTATRTRNGVTTNAYATGVLRTTQLTKLDNGRPDRRSVVTNSYTDGVDGTPAGRTVAVDDEGDTATATDDRCTRTTYARNDSLYLHSLTAEVQTTGLRCSVTPTQAAQVISVKRAWYDGGSSYPTTPTKGENTRIEELSVWDPNPANRRFVAVNRSTFDSYGRIVDSYDTLNNKTTTAYTPASGGPITARTRTNPKLWVTTTLYEPAFDTPTKITDQNGRVTDISYDALGRLVAVWLPGWSKSAHPSLASQAFSYLIRSSGGPSAVTTSKLDPAGTGYRSVIELYDGNLRIRQAQAPAATGIGRVITDTYYDSRGLAVKSNAAYYATGAPGTTLQLTADGAVPSQTRTTYDGAGRPTVVALVSQSVEKWRKTTAYGGDREDITPPSGGTATSTLFDARGQTVELRQYTGTSPTPWVPASYTKVSYGYDNAGRRVSAVDQAGVTWQWGFDQRGRAATTVDPDRRTTTSTFDDAGQLLATTDARNIVLVHVYDQLGRKTATWKDAVTTGTKLAEWTYDTAADAAGIAGHPMYGPPASATRWSDGSAYVSTTPSYDAANRPTGTVVTIPVSETGLAGTYTFGLTYNADGSVATTSLPATGGLAAETLTTTYSAAGLPLTLTGAVQYVSDTTYLETGQVTSLTNNTTVAYQQFNYDPSTLRLDSTSMQANASPDILADLRYRYDPAGNITSVANLLAQYGPGYGADDTQCFAYDRKRRLTDAWTPANNNCTPTPSVAGLGGAAPYWFSWTFDPVGNRETQTAHLVGGNQTTTYAYPSPTAARPHTLSSTTGATSATYGYDNEGNTTSRPGSSGQQTLTWDPEGHLATLVEGSATSSYRYDAMGTRLITRDATGRTLHLPFGMERHVDSGGGNATASRTYGHTTLTVATRSTTGGLSWLFTDHQGTATLSLRDSDMSITRRLQGPYGTVRGTPPAGWANQRGFLGAFKDQSGLTHVGAREYDPATGRFLSDDPITDLTNPQQANGYSYANASPVTLSDPDGLEPGSWCGTPECTQKYEQHAVNTRPQPPVEEPHCRVGNKASTYCFERGFEADVRSELQQKMEKMKADVADSSDSRAFSDAASWACGQIGEDCTKRIGEAQAAWCLTVTVTQCMQGMSASWIAFMTAKHIKDEHPTWTDGHINAFRHTFFTALMVGGYGFNVVDTMLLGTAHEMDVTETDQEWNSNNSVIDMHNNMVGAAIMNGMVKDNGGELLILPDILDVVTQLVDQPSYMGYWVNKEGSL